MKIERKYRRGTKELVLEITPLIDVVFLLLIFFLVATTFEDIKSGIKLDLPQSSITEIADSQELQIIATSNRQLSVMYKEGDITDTIDIERRELQEIIKNRLSIMSEKAVIISADKKLDYGFIVDLMTAVKEAGAVSINLNTAPQ